ncbi:ABC transporter permease [Telmatocola sphagniphila]|uniref:ABC transporter permease n=2 Tax=Telmatocola sphagniphila TaxID=1123043 RepID=A0A8E6BBU0_9BACT|nr:ABC transporter permease [Telmatocola sphagniphila]
MTSLEVKKKTFRWALWLGWQLDSNWTEPWLFAIYVLVKPLTSSLLLVCMYFAARQVTPWVPVDFLPYMYIGNACFMLIGSVMFGMSQAVLTDREHYRMLKYIYIAPGHLQTYFVGRAISGAFQAVLGGLINITIGALTFPEVRHALTRQPTEWGWLAVYLVLGTMLLTALGLILTAIVLNMNRQGMFLSEGISGILYLVCGVVFPISILPHWLSWVSVILPPTYWLEGMRRAILGVPAEKFLDSPLSHWGHPALAAALAGTTLGLLILSQFVFRWSERRAWRLGKFEEQSGA